MAFGLIAGLASMLNSFGNQTREGLEGEGTYDPKTGKFYDPKKVEQGYQAASIFAPHKIITDPNARWQDKVAAGLGFGFVSSAMGGSQHYREQREAELEKQQQPLNNMLASLQATETYKSPEEVGQLQALYSKGAASAREFGQEAVDIANMRAGSVEAPGMGIAREDISQATSGAVQDIVETGGAGASSLGAIVQARNSQMSQLRGLAIQNQEYKAQAERDYMASLQGQSQLEMRASGLEARGLETGINEKTKMYQSELDKERAIQQFNIMMLGNSMAQQQAQGAANQQANQGMFQSGLSSLGSYFSGSGSGASTSLSGAGNNGVSNPYDYTPPPRTTYGTNENFA